MLVTVPFLVDGRVIQTVVGTEVDDLGAPGEQGGDRLHAGDVGEAAEDHLGSTGDLGGPQIFALEIEPAVEALVNGVDGGRALLPGGEGGELHLGMPEEDLDEFERGVARGAEDGDLDHGGPGGSRNGVKRPRVYRERGRDSTTLGGVERGGSLNKFFPPVMNMVRAGPPTVAHQTCRFSPHSFPVMGRELRWFGAVAGRSGETRGGDGHCGHFLFLPRV